MSALPSSLARARGSIARARAVSWGFALGLARLWRRRLRFVRRAVEAAERAEREPLWAGRGAVE